jgi:hypothetical protein
MKTIRDIFIADAAVSGYRLIAARRADGQLPVGLDPRALRGQPPAKTTALGTCWTGSLKPLIDAQLDTMEQLVYSLGPSPKVLDIGTTWTGEMTAEISSAAREAAGARDDTVVDVTEVLGEVTGLNAELIGSTPTSVRINDALRRVRAAVARVGGGRTTRDAKGSLAQLVRITDEQRALGERLNDQARTFWAAKSTPPTTRAIGDNSGASTSAFRDAAQAVQHARTARELNEALNAQARAFWAR